jgi:hypothetical protein
MSVQAKGWLLAAAMLAGAFVAVELLASTLQNYETRPDVSSGARPSD